MAQVFPLILLLRVPRPSCAWAGMFVRHRVKSGLKLSFPHALGTEATPTIRPRTVALRAANPFWQARYYDFNVWSERKFVEKLRYIHRNPVQRGLVDRPEDWKWSSFRHYVSGETGSVEIESQWTARRREHAGIFPTVAETTT